MSEKQWITVKECANAFDAQMIRSILESEEIPVRMLNENMNNLYPNTGLITIELQVQENNKEVAAKIINEFSENEEV